MAKDILDAIRAAEEECGEREAQAKADAQERAAQAQKDAAALKDLALTSCMECGCCSFICPANRPLVQTNRLAKIFLREEQAKEAKK